MSDGRDFDGSVVVVTGASTGLGRAVAVEVAGRGAKAIVINFASSEAEAEETAAQVKALGAEPVLVKANVAEDAECRKIAEAAARFGRIDALFNNAGVTKHAPNHADLDALTDEDFIWLYRVNVIGAYQMVRAARSLLEAAPRPGAVVNTSSVAGVMGIGSSVAYAASKGALTTMTLSLARALAPKIRVNAVCLGLILSEQVQTMGEAVLKGFTANLPLPRAGTVEEAAEAYLYLMRATYVTGQIVRVDGGGSLV